MIDEATSTTLGALVGATTFAAGFLATRVHRQLDRALGIAQDMDDAVEAAAADGGVVEPGLFENQYRALKEASEDRLDRIALGVVVVLAGAVVVLSAAVSQDAGVGEAGGQESWLLLAFVVAAVVVLAASAADLVGARRKVRARLDDSVLGLAEDAESSWLGLEPTSERLSSARDAAEHAVRRARGTYGPSWLALGNVNLAAMAGPLPARDTWLTAMWALDRAVELGPESSALCWARAYAVERGPVVDTEEAVREYVRGLWLHHEGSRPLARGDEIVAQPRDRMRQVVHADGTFSATDLRFRPTTPGVLAGALRRIPAHFLEARLTAVLLRDATVGRDADEPGVEDAAEATWEWLERLREIGDLIGPAMVEAQVRELLGSQGAPAWTARMTAYLGPDGPVARAREEEEDEEAGRQAAWDDTHRRLTSTLRALDDAAGSRQVALDRGMIEGEHDAADVDWDEMLRALEQEQREVAQEHEEWVREQEAQMAESDRLGRELEESLARFERAKRGRSTEEDLAREPEPNPLGPWPEPEPRPRRADVNPARQSPRRVRSTRGSSEGISPAR